MAWKVRPTDFVDARKLLMTFANREKRILANAAKLILWVDVRGAEVAFSRKMTFARRAPYPPVFVNVVILWHLFRRLGKRCHSIGLSECVLS